MSSNLVVAVFGGCALFQVHRFEDCVFTEFFSDGKHRLLQLSLTLQVSSVGFLFLFFCCIICEKIELGKAVFLLQSSVLRDNVVGDNIQPADQERRIDKTIEKIDGGYKVSVGSVAHPMDENHYIQWIELLAGDQSLTCFLKPGDKPEAVFKTDAEKVTAREYCNLHGHWKAEN